MKSPILPSCLRAVPVVLLGLGASAVLAQAQAPLRTAVDATVLAMVLGLIVAVVVSRRPRTRMWSAWCRRWTGRSCCRWGSQR